MLTWDGNRHLIRKIKTAITAGIRPCAMIFHEQPSDPWVAFDFKLLEAYQTLQDETCPKCGHPIWLCRSETNRVEFKVRSDVCHAERALENARVAKLRGKDRDQARKNRKDWGRFFFTEPYNPPQADGGMPTRREYYESLTDRIRSDDSDQ